MTGMAIEAAPGQWVRRLAPGTFETTGPDAMRALGARMASALREGDVLMLEGGLGAGKTCLAGGIVAGLGDPDPVTSPTYQIMAVHDRGRLELFHFDLYRIADEDGLEDVGLFDVLGEAGVCVIEWGARFAQGWDVDRVQVSIAGEGVRTLELAGIGTRGIELAQAIDQVVASWGTC